MPRPKPRSSFRTAADRDDARELPPLQPGAGSLLVQARCHRRRNGVFGPTKTTTGLLARIAVVAVAVSSLAAGRAFERTMAAPHVSPVPYRLIQEPDAGYQPIIDLIRSAVSSVRMTTYEHAEDDAVTALADAHRRGVDVKVILDPHSTVSTPTKQPTMRFTPPASTSNGRPMMRSTTRNPSSSTTLSPPSVPETSPRSTTRPRPMPTFSPPAPATSSPSPPPSTPISPTSTSPGPSECPFGHRVGGCAIHVPAVVCANSPSTTTAYASVGVAGTDAVFSTSRVAPDDRLAGAQDATCPESPCCRPAYPIRPLTKPDSLVCLYLVVAMKKCLPRTRRTPSVAHRGYCPGIIG